MKIEELIVDGHFTGTTAQALSYDLADQATQFCVTLPGESQENVKKKLRTMAKTLAALRIAALAVLCLCLAGCNFSVFDACLTAAAGLEVATSASSATPAQKAEVYAWVQTLTAGVERSTIHVASGGTAAQIAVEVTADMAAAVVQGQQLTGLPQDLAITVAVTMASVNAILQAYQPPAATTLNVASQDTTWRTVTLPPPPDRVVKLSARDREHLVKIRARAAAISDDAQRAGQQ